MDSKLIRLYPDARLCANCLHERTDSKRTLISNKRLIRILSVAFAISIMISVFTMCMYIHLQVRVALHDAGIIKLQTDYQMLEEKYNAIVDGPSVDDGVLMAETVPMDPGNSRLDGSDSVASTSESARRASPSSHELVKRQATGKKGRKKRHKKGMTYIQIEGSGTQKKQRDKNAVTGYWSAPAWLRRDTKRFKAAKKAFKFDDITRTGKLKVKKSGMYLIYAQITLVGAPITGFHVSLSHSATNTEKLLQCTRYSNVTHGANTQSCFTMGIVELKANQEIFVQENQNNEGANYSDISYFGLIKIGD